MDEIDEPDELGHVTVRKSSRKEFKAGDYIVFYEGYNEEKDSYPLNYCYKQNMDFSCIRSIDIQGRENGWSARPFTSGEGIQKSAWRYATPEEILEYKLQGKPFDVRELASRDTYSVLSSIILHKDGNTPN